MPTELPRPNPPSVRPRAHHHEVTTTVTPTSATEQNVYRSGCMTLAECSDDHTSISIGYILSPKPGWTWCVLTSKSLLTAAHVWHLSTQSTKWWRHTVAST
jgi:hypothetical protein